MKELNLKFWLLAAWFACSLVLITSCTDFRLLLAALVNLYFCVSSLKTHEKDFKDIFENIL